MAADLAAVKDDGGAKGLGSWERTHTCIVKKCLAGALSPCLSDRGKQIFLDFVDTSTEMISRMSRRATMLLLYYVVRRFEDGLPLPDFNALRKNDAYWKQWLRVGLDEFGGHMPSPDVAPYFHEVKHWLGTSVGCGEPPEYFDRVLGHAAIALKTAVMNNLEFNLLSKVRRLCNAVANAHLPGKGTGYALFQSLCKGDVSEHPEWPQTVCGFVQAARGAMGLGPQTVLYEDTEISINTRMALQWWMQQRFMELGKRKLMLMPVMHVSRMHIRLDATTLYILAWKCYAPQAPETGAPTAHTHPDATEREAAEKAWNDGCRMPRKASHPDAGERATAMKVYRERKAAADEHKRVYKAAMAAFVTEHPSYSKLSEDAPPDPRAQLAAAYPPVSIGRRPDGTPPTDPAWLAHVEKRRVARAERLRARDAVQMSDKHKAAVAVYAAYEGRVHAFAMLLFRPFTDKRRMSGWAPSSSICTDGVSVSIAYERTEQVPYTCPKASATKLKEQRAAARSAKKDRAELAAKDDYDPEAPTMTDDHLILGIDPGRTHLVTVVCIDEHGKKHTWRLSRGQYYTEGGILRENRRQAARYAPLAACFASLTDDGGSLRASRSEELHSYFERYAACEAQWWKLALRRRESRAKMQRYIGKKAVLARFFSTLRKDAEKMMVASGRKRIEVAYGSAGLNMAASGRGEAAVPTGGTYKACQLEFGKAAVAPTWEHNTSAISWHTGKAYESVYKRYNLRGGRESLHHVATKQMPEILEDAADGATTKAAVEAVAEAAKRRRGGSGGPRTASHAAAPSAAEVEETKKMKLRYPACRGLRFCPERRMFYDRDEASAIAIAGLRRLELQGFGRPSAFRCKSKKISSTAVLRGLSLKSKTR